MPWDGPRHISLLPRIVFIVEELLSDESLQEPVGFNGELPHLDKREWN
jgi:hypothetical protein